MGTRLETSAVLAVALTAATLAGSAAIAQTDAQDEIARCRALPTETERFACMEAVVLDLSSRVEGAAPPAPIASEAPAATAPAESGPVTAAPTTAPVTAAPPAAAPVTASTAAPAPETFGSERLQTERPERAERERLEAQVVSFEEAPVNRLRVVLDNGQVWEQRDAVPPWREEQYGAPDAVELYRSRFGGYRMRLVGQNLTLRVERVR